MQNKKVLFERKAPFLMTKIFCNQNIEIGQLICFGQIKG